MSAAISIQGQMVNIEHNAMDLKAKIAATVSLAARSVLLRELDTLRADWKSLNAQVAAMPVALVKGYYTVVLADGSHVTFRIMKPKFGNFSEDTLTVAYFNGTENTDDKSYRGFAFSEGTHIAPWKKVAGTIPTRVNAAFAILRKGDFEGMGKEYARRSGNCYVCNRLLTNPESIALSIGPECRKNRG